MDGQQTDGRINRQTTRKHNAFAVVFKFNSWCGTFILASRQPLRSTQPGHPFVGRRNEYQPKGGDALKLGSNGRHGTCVVGR